MVLKDKKIEEMTSKELVELFQYCDNLIGKIEDEQERRKDKSYRIISEIEKLLYKLHQLGFALKVDTDVLNYSSLAELNFIQKDEYDKEGREVIELT